MLAPQQQVEQELRQQQGQIEQLRQEYQQQSQQLRRMTDLLERQAQEKPVCSAEIRWVNSGEPRKVPAAPAAVVPLNFLSTVSKPSAGCLPAEVRLTASYLDAAGNLVCSGVIENLAVQNALAQNINLDIRPWNLREFARWRNEPPQINSGPKRLVCIDAEGLDEATTEELSRISSLRVGATILAAGSGMSTAEILITLQR